jgi:HK97 family phage major capsid protein
MDFNRMAITIADLKRKRATLVAEMKAISTKDAPEEGDSSRFDDLEAQVKDHDERIGRIEAVNEMAAKDGDEADDDMENAEKTANARESGKFPKGHKAASVGFSKRPTHEAKGTRAARFIVGAGLNKAVPGSGTRYIRDDFEDLEVSKALGATISSASGGALIPQDFRNEIIDLLYAETAVRANDPQMLPMPFGNITIPRLSTGSAAYWQGENQDITISQPTFDDLQLFAKKLTAMVPVSNDLIRRSPLAVESIVRTNMIKMLARAEDIAFLTGAANVQYTPAGITALVSNTNTFTSNAVGLSAVNNVLSTMELAVKGANISTKSAGWVFHPSVRAYLNTLTDSVGRYFFREELDRGTLFGYKFTETTQLANNLGGSSNGTPVMFVAWDNVLLGDTLDMFADSSMEASYVSGGNVVSAYSRDQTVFRVIEEVDLNMMHPQAAAVTTVYGWDPTGYAGSAGAPYVTQPPNISNSAAESAVIV